MVNLTATSDLLVSFGGREAETGDDKGGDEVGLGLPQGLPSQSVFSVLPLQFTSSE